MNKSKKFRILLIFLLVAWMALIFIMSAQPAKQSSQLSSGIVTRVISAVYSDFEELSPSQQTNVTYTATFIVRKTAHFSEYFILGLLAFGMANTLKKYRFSLCVLSAALFSVLYAVSDEVHQYFVPGRACRFSDICIDAAGSILAIALLTVITRCKSKHKSGELNA